MSAARQRHAQRPGGSPDEPRPTMVQPLSGIASPAALQSQQRAGELRIANTAVTALLGAWLLSISLGVALHSDLLPASNKALKEGLPLSWFDELLRRYGALLPFPAFACRWWAAALAEPGPDVRPAAHFAEAFCLYTGLTLARLLLYGLHVVGVLHWLCRGLVGGDPWHGGQHLMSDHIVLGASLTALLMAEAALGAADLRRCLRAHRAEPFRLLCLGTGLALSCVLCTAVVGDMFFTARLFHGRAESLGGVLVGGLLFQGPVACWLLAGRA